MNNYKRLTISLSNGKIGCLQEYSQKDLINRLAELEDKIENGTLIELPFLVGQDAFIIENNEIVIGVVNGIWWQDDFLIEVRYNKGKYGWSYAQRLKNGIFSTKAEVEAKLKDLRGE